MESEGNGWFEDSDVEAVYSEDVKRGWGEVPNGARWCHGSGCKAGMKVDSRTGVPFFDRGMQLLEDDDK